MSKREGDVKPRWTGLVASVAVGAAIALGPAAARARALREGARFTG
jgi:hypothetical protein